MDYKSFSQIFHFGIDYIEFSPILSRQKFEISTLTASIIKEASSDHKPVKAAIGF